MPVLFDLEAISTIFTQPNLDGSFPQDLAQYLDELGRSRPSVVLAFPPKAAGTFLRSAAITAVDGKLVRTVHALGGRDAAFYLPFFLMYYAGGFPAETMVTHVHMQALAANTNFIEALNLRPAIMIRSIPDMLASYADMLEPNPLSQEYWLNAAVPNDYPRLSEEQKGDFLVDVLAPWYVSYFVTWIRYAAKSPERVLVLHYDAFLEDPVLTLETLLAHSGLPRSPEHCRRALESVWAERHEFRFNQGICGRGRQRFAKTQIARLERQVGYYPELACVRDLLIPPP